MQRIPRGVADDTLAVVATRAGVLVGLDPRTGAVSWRLGTGMRACALTASVVVAVRGGGPDGPEVVVLDRGDGREIWAALLPGLPGWAQHPVADDRECSLDCTLGDGEVLLRWRASTRYEGAAAPDERVLAESSRQADGAVRIDLPARSVHAVPADEQAPRGDDPVPGGPHPGPRLAPDVVDAGRLGALRVELTAPAAPRTVVLRAVDVAREEVLWEVALDEQAHQPPRLRP